MYQENGRSHAERQAANERLRGKYPHMTPYFDAVQEFAGKIAEEVRVPLRVEERKRLFVASAFRDYPDQADTIAKMAGFDPIDIPRVVREAYAPDLQRVIRIAEEKKEEAKMPYKQLVVDLIERKAQRRPGEIELVGIVGTYAAQLEEVYTAYVAHHPRTSTKGPNPGSQDRIRKLNSLLRQRQAGKRNKDITIQGTPSSRASIGELASQLIAMGLLQPLSKEQGLREETERKLEEIWDIQTDHPDWTPEQIAQELRSRGTDYTTRTVQERIGILMDEGLLEPKHRSIEESAEIIKYLILEMVLENPDEPIDKMRIAGELRVTKARVNQIMNWMNKKRETANTPIQEV